MANMTQDAQRPSKGERMPWAFGTKGAALTFYKGGIVMVDISDNNYAQPRLSAITVTTSDVFLGVAMENVVVASTASDNGQTVKCFRKGIFGFAASGLTAADKGKAAYASDDQTITTTSTNNLWVGQIVDVDATYVWVEIDRATAMQSSAT